MCIPYFFFVLVSTTEFWSSNRSAHGIFKAIIKTPTPLGHTFGNNKVAYDFK